MEKFICRPDNNHWCVSCCDGRNCEYFGELPDGKWGCLNREKRPKPCKAVNCLKEMRISYNQAMEKILSLPPGEFNAEIVLGSKPASGEIEI